MNEVYMNIIHQGEIAAQNLERQGLPEKGEKLRQDVSHIITEAKNNPQVNKSNLSKFEQKGLKFLKKEIENEKIAVAPHDKGLGFVTQLPSVLDEKAYATFQNVTLDTPNRTKAHEGTIQRKLLKLKKENKINDADYKQIYPSGSTTPTAYPLVKAHKPNKNYPVRLVVSHRGCPQEALSAYLVPLLQPLLKNSPFQCKNSVQFVKKTKDITLYADEILVSWDAEGLYPSIPLKKCIALIKQRLINDETLSSRTSLTPTDIFDLINLCVATSDFIYKGRHHTAKDSGPIGLSIMVPIAEVWMDHTLKEAVKIATERGINVPRSLMVYMDDTFGILRQNAEKNAHIKFTVCLAAVDPRLKFTWETEENKEIPFLDAHAARLDNGKIIFRVYRKSSNTGLTIDPNSNQDPSTWIGVFKGALCRAYRICSTPSLLKEEIDFLINNFEDNGFNRKHLQKIARDYRPREFNQQLDSSSFIYRLPPGPPPHPPP